MRARKSILAVFVMAAIAAAAPSVASAVTPKIDTGMDFTCALDVTGSVKCWGAGGYGQLGNGTFDDSLVPVQVSGLTDAVDISVGYEHSCAIRVSGAAVCWGGGAYGRMGYGSAMDSSVPVDVTGLSSGVTSISAGANHSCAVQSGAAKCWGLNSDKQLGDNTTTASIVPVGVIGLTSGVGEIAAGYYHSCAVQNGAARCWGGGGSGELGDGNGVDSGTVVNVTGLGSGVTSIAAGDRISCASHNGSAKCWGEDFWGGIGNGAPSSQQNSPVQVTGLTSGVSQIDVLRYHVCAIQNGTVFCWGYNGNGELGDGGTASTNTPNAVPGAPAPATDVSVGGYSTCATNEAVAACWGMNDAGQSGNGTASGADTPQDVVGMGSGVTSLDVGSSLSCAAQSGAAKCWGAGDDYGQLGNGVYAGSAAPVQVSGLTSGVSVVGTGAYHACAVHSGAVKCWGYDSDGEVGNGGADDFAFNTPQTVSGVTPSTTDGSLGLGAQHTCARHDDDAGAPTNYVFRCWGKAGNGRLGNNSVSPDQVSPVAVTTIAARGLKIAGGNQHTCATQQDSVLLQPNTLYCWGSDTSGALGNGGGDTDVDEPTVVPGASGAFDVSAGRSFTCAVLAPVLLIGPNTAKCWGEGIYGQLGDGTYGNESAPVTVTGLTDPSSIAAGGAHACAVDGGAVKCWGDNYEGQLGDGTHTERNAPVTVTGISDAVKVAAGGDVTCALLISGAVKCWGDGYNGALGTGIPASLTSPVTVQGYSPTPPPAQPAPAPGAMKLSLKPGKIKRKRGKWVVPVAVTSAVPAGFTTAQACSGRLGATITFNRRKYKTSTARLKTSGSRCNTTLTFKLPSRPAKRKKYALRATHAGNEAFLKYAKTTKLVLRKR